LGCQAWIILRQPSDLTMPLGTITPLVEPWLDEGRLPSYMGVVPKARSRDAPAKAETRAGDHLLEMRRPLRRPWRGCITMALQGL
jgi:hypothetical protein